MSSAQANPLHQGDQWLQRMIGLTTNLSDPADQRRLFGGRSAAETLIAGLIDAVEVGAYDGQTRRVLLAAAFDLVVAAEYYSRASHVGWIYCPSPAEQPLLLYPYTNACPRCVLRDQFIYHAANKLGSGRIGATTSRLLALFIQELLNRKGLSVEVRKGSEPVDVAFIDRSTHPTTVFFAEIKASPLLTLPLAVESQQLTMETDGHTEDVEHRATDHPHLFGSEIGVFVPVRDQSTGLWKGRAFTVGRKRSRDDEEWAYRGLASLVASDASFLSVYLDFWRAAFESYGSSDRHAVFWLTGACGGPYPRPEDWRRRASGGGYESISDSKTSVGMDRTDDLKKATSQALKIGAAGKPSNAFSYKVGIVSNVHAVRHFDEYLDAIKEIIWTKDATGSVTRAGDLLPDAELFNLFDGIITLTETRARDAWIRTTFDF